MDTSETEQVNRKSESRPLEFLNQRQVIMIDEALSSLGEYGEVRLIVEKGRLRFLVTQKSFDALKWQPGSLAQEIG
jgi:hypothetical protein